MIEELRSIALQTWERAEHWRLALIEIQTRTDDPKIKRIIESALLFQGNHK